MSPFIQVLLLVTLSMVIVVAHPVKKRSESEGNDGITRLEKALKNLVSLDDYIGAFIGMMKKRQEENEVPDEQKDDAELSLDKKLTKVDGIYLVFDSAMSGVQAKIEALKDNADHKTDNGKAGAHGVKSLIQPLQDYLQFAMM